MNHGDVQSPNPAYPCLPLKTAKIVFDYTNPSNQCRNIALLLDKYIPRNVIEQPASSRLAWLHKIAAISVDEALLMQLYRRWSHMMDALDIQRFSARIEWRMIVGLGSGTVLETDMTLHHLYGIPYIPASALKGLTRAHAARQEGFFVSSTSADNGNDDKKVAEKRRPARKAEEDHPDIQRIFGSQKVAGTVRFFDAMPVPSSKSGQPTFALQCDIMTPHYGKYYDSLKSNNIQAPSNDNSPNPIAFLTVADTTFDFALAPRDSNDAKHRDDVERVRVWLLKALQNDGIGGKTSSGYGFFKEDPQPIQKEVEQLIPWQRPKGLPEYLPDTQLPPVCTVIKRDEPIIQNFPSATAFLRYKEFSTSAVLIVIEDDFPEGQSWHPNDSNKKCIFLREELHESRLIWFCKPVANTNKNKSKSKK